ncbi:ABC transporter permease subunit [Natronospira bacteriovora]|uniref:ABC transporter permease subunit n=1 Tax=Natronospira bacteriovora TaxID=3069753 RepID=A0ABU0W4H8_9GAMM|nr:ABC transporter permease subunit [Natronospira sp. AB-CW4]MDQ2068365.1 ABC transporter permease subunit [Natronospira sp. AB-CW4]
MAKGLIATAGVGVIIALGTIFVYLFSEVVPLFQGARLEQAQHFEMPGSDQAETLYVASERHQVAAVRFARDGVATFFNPRNGDVLDSVILDIPTGTVISSFAAAEPRSGVVAFGLSDGRALVVRHEYGISYPGGERKVTPSITYPLGEEPIRVSEAALAIRNIAVQEGARGFAIIAELADGSLHYARYEGRRNFMTGEMQLTRSLHQLPTPPYDVSRMLVDITLRNLIIGDEIGNLHYYDIHRPADAQRRDSVSVVEGVEGGVTAMEYLLGTVSVIVGGADGSLTQWFLVRDQDNIGRLTRIREFDRQPGAITHIFPEYSRKGFLVGDDSGHLGVHYATSARTLSVSKVSDDPITRVAMTPRNDGVLFAAGNQGLAYAGLHNPHPEISFAALWNRVWYEGREKPEYVWQSSSATDEFEPKFSFVPLSVGTLKAAFYAMLFAMPLAIMGAIYSAYFMTPRMRGYVKPTIEIMEALPTVILGFLAGLWMAPFVENHLPAVFSVLILMPLLMLVTAFLWTRVVPAVWRERVPPGWEAAILIPLVLFVGWISVYSSPWIEIALFDGDMRQWFTDQGIAYDQRNALVVGIAMGFAVIPTIFSIAEDAIFNVPKHLTQGSLALGATPWQTMVGVVLLTASPGIFSAVMIGFGRAVGETMIVLMATGNSPVVNFNIFEGMRTLSANIAVEMSEAARGGSHYRILFLAALVLFMATFILNTIAEIVRQRLRRKYSSL